MIFLPEITIYSLNNLIIYFGQSLNISLGLASIGLDEFPISGAILKNACLFDNLHKYLKFKVVDKCEY